jgi:hypothetical protein
MGWGNGYLQAVRVLSVSSYGEGILKRGVVNGVFFSSFFILCFWVGEQSKMGRDNAVEFVDASALLGVWMRFGER